jgi:serine/threonine protein kinase
MSSSATAQDMPLADNVAPLSYSWSMLDMVVLHGAVSYTFMCRNKQLIVNILAERLRGEGGLADAFYRFREDDLNDPDVYVDFETWVIDAVDEHIERLAGLVHWDGREDVLMGMLLEQIDGPTLFHAASRASAADKSKWMDQIDETVRELHQHGLVWGDVKLDNVMIAPSGDAVVIDFGGGGTLQYIDVQLHETREGDLQGIGKMRAKLLGGEGRL